MPSGEVDLSSGGCCHVQREEQIGVRNEAEGGRESYGAGPLTYGCLLPRVSVY